MPKYLDETGLAHFWDNIKTKPVHAFNNVADMVAATGLETGTVCHTSGFASFGDGFGGWYRVVDSSASPADGFQVIAYGSKYLARLIMPEGAKPSRQKWVQLEPVVAEADSDLAEDMATNGLYAQGATTDGTNVFVYAVPQSGVTAVPKMYKLDSSFEMVSSITLSDGNTEHGNSVFYDSTLGMVVIVSSNGASMRVSTDLSTHTKIQNLSNVRFSEFCADDAVGIGNIKSTNQYVFYNRHANGIFTACGVANIDLMRGGGQNYLQDCFIANNLFYAVSSSSSFGVSIACIGKNGVHVCDYVNGVVKKEMEGAFVLDSYVYLIDADGGIWRVSLDTLTPSLISIGTTESSDIQPWLNYVITSTPSGVDVSNVIKFVQVPYDSTHVVNFMVKAPNLTTPLGNTASSDAPTFRWANFRGLLQMTRVNNGSYRVNGFLPHGRFLMLNYTVSGTTQYLAVARVSAIDGSYVRKAFTASTTDAEYESGLAELFTDANAGIETALANLSNNYITIEGLPNQAHIESNYGLFCI